jgi:hypothetical protein
MLPEITPHSGFSFLLIPQPSDYFGGMLLRHSAFDQGGSVSLTANQFIENIGTGSNNLWLTQVSSAQDLEAECLFLERDDNCGNGNMVSGTDLHTAVNIPSCNDGILSRAKFPNYECLGFESSACAEALDDLSQPPDICDAINPDGKLLKKSSRGGVCGASKIKSTKALKSTKAPSLESTKAPTRAPSLSVCEM